MLAEQDISASVPVVVLPDLRRKVSRLAAAFYPSEKVIKLAVTGTNGKTSTVFYVQQLLNRLNIQAASLGTIGIDIGTNHTAGHMTTPDAVALNKTLNHLQAQGIRVVALEASSHGLDQGRLDGLTFAAGAFTNLTQDHLDYHKTMEAYLAAKEHLFADYVTAGGFAVLNADDSSFEQLKTIALKQGEKVISYGRKGMDLQLIQQKPTTDGQDIVLKVFGKEYATHLNIVGDFQASNLCAALGLCLGAGAKVEDLIPLLPTLQAPTGRLEWMGATPTGGQVFVDYAHTPDAVERVLKSLRAHTENRLICVLGCGGNRDTTKRPLMGAAANNLADVVYVTDDNPRLENPADIRRAIMAACPKGIEMGNREEAIHAAIADLRAGDVVVLAGKGHEPGQTIGTTVYAMDDRIEAKLAILNQTKQPIWNAADLALALSVRVPKRVAAYGLSIDTRTIRLGDLFIALKGEQSDGHAYVKMAVEKGAAACIVDHLVEQVPPEKQILVSDTMEALNTLAKFARMRSSATFIGVTGSSGKTTAKEMLKACLRVQGKTHATAGNFNNQIGTPLTLASMPTDTRYAVIEMGMNHAGELMHLSDMVRPDVTLITSIGSAHREFFKTEQDVATAKSEIFDYQNRQGTAVLNADSPFYAFLKEAALGQNIQHICSFGEYARADYKIISETITAEGTDVVFEACHQPYQMRLNFLGHHFVMDALGVLAVVQAAGGNIESAISALATVQPVAGRGALLTIDWQGKKITVIDDAYNANPSSMAASIASLGLRRGKRKIAVLGDMLELGNTAVQMHMNLKANLEAAGVDKVYTVGPLMKELFEQLSSDQKGGCADKAADIVPILTTDLQEGDIVLVKASHGTGLQVIIQALKGNK